MAEDCVAMLDRAPAAERWVAAARAIGELARARTIDDVSGALRGSARDIMGADGVALALRDTDACRYVATDGAVPFASGLCVPLDRCAAGWAMIHGEPALIADTARDSRLPLGLAQLESVRGMLIVPIGLPEPAGALCAYWFAPGGPGAADMALLESLAHAAATALHHARLVASVERLTAQLEACTAARFAERERAETILRQTQKMEMVGQLTGSVAHDFNNLLAPIMAGLDLVLGGRAGPSRIMQGAGVAMEAAEAAKMLVQRLLAFVRRQPPETIALDLARLVEDMASLIASTIGTRIALDLRLARDLPAVCGDRHQLEMALLNLAVNARDAMPGEGVLTITLARLPEDPRFLRLAVRDTGCGMDAPTRAAATEPFFTTKEAGRGTGLGLAMVERLTHQLGGRLDIMSQPGQGTEIGLILPATPERTPVVRAEATGEARGGRGTVLLVDDDLLVRVGTGTMLEDLGYDVIEAEHASAALERLAGGLVPDIVVTDHLMPGMTGAELAQRLRADHPRIAVLIVSGYQEVERIAPDIVRLAKPFRAVHLDNSIAAARAQVARN